MHHRIDETESATSKGEKSGGQEAEMAFQFSSFVCSTR